MTSLAEQRCKPCEGGVAPLTLEEARALMKQLSGDWKLAADGKSIRAEWKFRNFYHTMSFVNAVAHLAEAANHHPDVDIRYSTITIALVTHDEGGITGKDVALAREIEDVRRRAGAA